jgi:ribosomal protein S18 acetylase RimI-like enzyme
MAAKKTKKTNDLKSKNSDIPKNKKIINDIKLNYQYIRIDVVSKNTNAISFYEKNGFQKRGSKILGKNINVTIMTYGN